MKREFFVNIIFLLAVNLLIKPFYIFGIDRTVQNLTGEAEYGLYFSLLAVIYMLQALNDLGLRNFNNRTIAQHPHLLDKLMGHVLGLKVVLAIFFGMVLLGASFLLGYDSPREHFILLVLWLNQVLISLTLYFRSNISGVGAYRTDSVLSALNKFLAILIVGALILFGPKPFRIEYFVLGEFASLFLTATVAFVLNRNKLRGPLRIRFNGLYFRSILRQSFPFALIILLTSIYTRIDTIMLRQLLADGTVEAGIYAAGYRLLDAVNMIGFLFAGLLLPIFSKMLKQREDVAPLVQTSAQFIWAGAIPLAIGAVTFQTEIMELLYDEATPYYGRVLAPLMLSFVAVAGNYIYGTLLTANGNLRRMNILFAVSIPINALLNAWLIPYYGAVGAGWATFATQSAVLLAQMELARSIVGLRFNATMAVRLLVFVVGISGVGYGLAHHFLLDWWVKWVLLFGVAVTLAFLLNLMEWRNALDYLRRSKKLD